MTNSVALQQEEISNPGRKRRDSMNLTIPLIKMISQKDGSVYYLAHKLTTFSLDFSEGYVFFIYTSEEGMEEVQIGNLDPETDRFSFYHISQDEVSDKLKFKIFPRQDRNGQTFFIGKLKLPASMTFYQQNSSIMAFTSVPGSEECQLQGTLVHHTKE